MSTTTQLQVGDRIPVAEYYGIDEQRIMLKDVERSGILRTYNASPFDLYVRIGDNRRFKVLPMHHVARKLDGEPYIAFDVVEVTNLATPLGYLEFEITPLDEALIGQPQPMSIVANIGNTLDIGEIPPILIDPSSPPITADIQVSVTARSVVSTQFPTDPNLGDICYRTDLHIEFRCVVNTGGETVWRSEKFLLPFSEDQNRSTGPYFQSSSADVITMRAALPILPTAGTQVPVLRIAGIRYMWEGDQPTNPAHSTQLEVYSDVSLPLFTTDPQNIPSTPGLTAQYVDDPASFYGFGATARQAVCRYKRVGLINASQRFFVKPVVWVNWEYEV